jgi:glycosyltransferase involved in cell wall biosynthesis
MKKKILHIITGLEVGGAETNLARILPCLEKEFENRVCCLIGRGPKGKILESNNIPVYYLDVKNIFDFWNPRVIFNFRKIVKEFHPDIIETYLIHSDIFGRIWGRIFGVKKILCSHRGSLLQWQWLFRIDKMTSFLVTKYIFQTPSAQKEISKKLGISIGRTISIPNVIDLKDFEFDINKNKKGKELGIKEGNINIVSVSNLRKGKGHQYLIEAFNNVYCQGYKNINLIIVGDGDQRPVLQNQADTCEAKDNIYLLGKRSDVLEILKISDIFILATFYEGMSTAVMEAMATGLSIITTDIDVNKDLIKDGHSGILVPVADSQAICDNIIRLLNNPEERKRLGENSLVEIKNNYSLEIVASKITNFLQSL